MNNIKKTIGWADFSWNPIKGECPVACWYCYERRRKQRLKLDKAVRLDEKELFAPINRWGKRGAIMGGAKRIFVCSIFDLFAPVADQWRDKIFDTIALDVADTFIILTKLPERIDRPMPDNVWLGVSITGAGDWERVDELMKHTAKVRFVSMEPLMGSAPEFDPTPDWIICGRLTGHGRKNDPTKGQLITITRQCVYGHIPLFMKSNLQEIWGGKLIQEWPK